VLRDQPNPSEVLKLVFGHGNNVPLQLILAVGLPTPCPYVFKEESLSVFYLHNSDDYLLIQLNRYRV